MKRFLLSLVAAAFVATTISAQAPAVRSKAQTKASKALPFASAPTSEMLANAAQPIKVGRPTTISTLAKSKAAEADPYISSKALTYFYQPTDTAYSAAPVVPADSEIGFYTRFRKDLLKRFAGNKITDFLFVGPFGTPLNTKVCIYEYDDATEAFTCVKEFATDSIREWEQAHTPIEGEYVITGDHDIFVGYTATLGKSALFPESEKVGPVVFPSSTTSDGLYILFGGKWFPFASYIFPGEYAKLMTVCLTEGEKGLLELDATDPYIEDIRGNLQNGQTVNALVECGNKGTTPITDIDYRYEVGSNVKEGHVDFATPIAYDSYAQFEVPVLLDNAPSRQTCTFTITKVNGQPDQYTTDNDNLAKSNVLTLNGGFPRTAVIEEYTSTNFPYAAYGLVGLPKVQEAYGNQAVVISRHTNSIDPTANPDYADPYADGSTLYDAVSNYYSTGLGSVSLNRQKIGLNPYYGYTGNIVDDVKPFINSVCEAAMELQTTTLQLGRKINVTCNVQFSMPVSEGEYGISYIVTEDSLKEANQFNGFYGITEELPEDMTYLTTEQTQSVIVDGEKIYTYPTTHNNVVRAITSAYGAEEENRVPALEAKKTHTHTAIFDTPIKITSNRSFNVTALLIDFHTGAIAQAVRCPLKLNATNTGCTVGIANVEARPAAADIAILPGAFAVKAQSAKAAVYTLDGKLVSSATINGEATLPTFGQGTFIIRVEQNGNITTKKAVF